MACFTSGVSRSWAPILKQNRNTVAGKGLITKNGHIMTRPHLWSPMCWWASLVAQRVKCLPAMQETWVRSLGQEDPLEKEMATHSSTLAWKIPWTEKPGRLQSMGSQRVGHNWATSLLSMCWWEQQLLLWKKNVKEETLSLTLSLQVPGVSGSGVPHQGGEVRPSPVSP